MGATVILGMRGHWELLHAVCFEGAGSASPHAKFEVFINPRSRGEGRGSEDDIP
jgi:hypothetical protein